MLTALSLGAGGGRGFLPAAVGRLAGGAGGVGFALTAGLVVPLAATPLVDGGGGGTCRIAGGAGGGVGLGLSSSRYADGAQPCEEPSSFLASHQPGIDVSGMCGLG